MQELGFKKSQADNYLYILHEEGAIILLVLTYVNDMAVTGKELVHIEKYKADLAKHVNVINLEELHYIFDIQIKEDCTAQTIMLNQTTHIYTLIPQMLWNTQLAPYVDATHCQELSISHTKPMNKRRKISLH